MSRLCYLTAITGLLGLFALILVWNAWLFPPQVLPRALVLAILLVPLVFPLRGMLAGRAYTHAWASYLAMPYFVIGVFHAAGEPVEKLYGWIMVLLSLAWMAGSALYPRMSRREKGQAR